MKGIRVVKIGGNVINKPAYLADFLKVFAAYDGPQILVHGGGRTATELAEKLGVETQMIEGKRVTSAEMLDLCKMVYAGLINKDIIASLQSLGCNALGMSGADANSIASNRKSPEPVDYGFIGVPKADAFPSETFEGLFKLGLTPVFCALTHDEAGQLLNTNADTIASTIAIGCSKIAPTELIYCFEKKGVLSDANDDDSVIDKISKASYQQLKADGVVSDGMIPKLDNCFDAVAKGVDKVVIKHADFLNEVSGTTIQ